MNTTAPSHWLARRLQALGHARRGLRLLLAEEAHAQVHLAASVVVVALGWWLQLPPGEWALLALAMGAVWALEAMNAALERVVDLASPQWHALARDAKDLAAAAVLLASLGGLCVGVAVFGPRLWSLL